MNEKDHDSSISSEAVLYLKGISHIHKLYALLYGKYTCEHLHLGGSINSRLKKKKPDNCQSPMCGWSSLPE